MLRMQDDLISEMRQHSQKNPIHSSTQANTSSGKLPSINPTHPNQPTPSTYPEPIDHPDTLSALGRPPLTIYQQTTDNQTLEYDYTKISNYLYSRTRDSGFSDFRTKNEIPYYGG